MTDPAPVIDGSFYPQQPQAVTPAVEPAEPAPVPAAAPVKPTTEAAVKSLTGFDEIAIERAFGKDLSDLSGTMMTRALVFVLARRGGQDDGQALRHALGMPLGDVESHFAESEVTPSPEG